MTQLLYQLTAKHFVAGLLVSCATDRVNYAAPILDYMTGWTSGQVKKYAKRKGWSVRKVPQYLSGTGWVRTCATN